MNITHSSAEATHYDQESATYDLFNETSSAPLNALIQSILSEHHVQSVLDLTCGTGSQVFHLADSGYEVFGVDINKRMLDIARGKAKNKNLDIQFQQGDMRYTQAGKFDAALTIFNAVGHLTRADFELSMRNIHNNLTDNGLYIFDIFNLSYLLKDDNITKLTMDILKKENGRVAREIQYSTISESGVLASYDVLLYEKVGNAEANTATASQTLQVYTATMLKDMLHTSGFSTLEQLDITGTPLDEYNSERILTIARKK